MTTVTTQRTMTLLEAAEWFRWRTGNYQQGFKADDLASCFYCGERGSTPGAVVHRGECPYAAAVRAIEQAR